MMTFLCLSLYTQPLAPWYNRDSFQTFFTANTHTHLQEKTLSIRFGTTTTPVQEIRTTSSQPQQQQK